MQNSRSLSPDNSCNSYDGNDCKNTGIPVATGKYACRNHFFPVLVEDAPMIGYCSTRRCENKGKLCGHQDGVPVYECETHAYYRRCRKCRKIAGYYENWGHLCPVCTKKNKWDF